MTPTPLFWFPVGEVFGTQPRGRVISCFLCVTVGKPDVEFQTPAVSEKFQGRFGWRPRAESETDPGAKTTDSTEGETEI